jgi:hypothetical protein
MSGGGCVRKKECDGSRVDRLRLFRHAVCGKSDSHQHELTLKDITQKKSQTGTSSGGASLDAFRGVQTYTSSGATFPIPTFTTVSLTKGSLKEIWKANS